MIFLLKKNHLQGIPYCHVSNYIPEAEGFSPAVVKVQILFGKLT